LVLTVADPACEGFGGVGQFSATEIASLVSRFGEAIRQLEDMLPKSQP
jgi:hypothetical protein